MIQGSKDLYGEKGFPEIMKAKFLTFIFTAVFAAFLISGCGIAKYETVDATTEFSSTEEEEHILKVGFSQYASYNDWRKANTDDINSALNSQGWDVIFADAEDDTGRQISDIEKMIAEHPDYLVIAPREQKGFRNVLKKASNAGIGIILYDRLADGPYDVLIQSDYTSEGENIGQAVVDTFGEEKEVHIVELTGTPGADVSVQRAEGFRDVIDQHGNYKILDSRIGNFSRDESETAMAELIKAYGNEIDVVYAHSDDNAIGAVNAIKAAGLTPGKDILVFGIDGTKDGLRAIVNGEMTATFLCNPFYGDAIVGLINDLETGKTFDDRVILKGMLYNIENAQDALDAGDGI